MRYVLSLLLLICAGCETSKPEAPPVGAQNLIATPVTNDRRIDWHKVGPIPYLSNLQALAKEGWPFFTICNPPPKGWITEADVRILRRFVDSNEPAAHVVMAISSYLPRSMSTVGEQARFLLRGYREGRYPPALHSDERK